VPRFDLFFNFQTPITTKTLYRPAFLLRNSLINFLFSRPCPSHKTPPPAHSADPSLYASLNLPTGTASPPRLHRSTVPTRPHSPPTIPRQLLVFPFFKALRQQRGFDEITRLYPTPACRPIIRLRVGRQRRCRIAGRSLSSRRWKCARRLIIPIIRRIR
jgi:hypothetical protein